MSVDDFFSKWLSIPELEKIRIPESLDECNQRSSVVNRLLKRAESTRGLHLATQALTVCGALVSLMFVVGLTEEFFAWSTALALLPWVLLWTLCDILFNAIEDAQISRAAIVRNTEISAKIALYTAGKTEHITKSKGPVDATEQEETHHFTIPESTVHTRTRKEPAVPSDSPVSPTLCSADTIICPNCNMKQAAERKSCWSCGQKFTVE